MDAERAAAYVGLSRSKLLELVDAGDAPAPLDLGGCPRWDRRRLDDWLDAKSEYVKKSVKTMAEILEARRGAAEAKVRPQVQDRHGRTRHYFRKREISRPLPGMPGTAAFMEEYDRLLGQHTPAPAKLSAGSPGTLAWVITQYRIKSKAWAKVKPSTRATYDRHFLHLRDNYGAAAFHTITERDVREIRNEPVDRPSIADATVDMIGRLWRFAKEDLNMSLGVDPTREVSAIHTDKESHKAWRPELCAAIERHPNRAVVRAYYLLRYTGQRRSDVARMKAKQFDGTAVELYQVKTGAYVWMPAHKRLIEHLAGRGDRGEHLLESNRKTRYTDESLSRLMREACASVGYPGYSPHGLRHLAGASLAEAGCSVHEIMSVLGHVTEDEAMHYVKQANRKKMATTAMAKWNAE
jgi:integrase/predicted DNA-binding transcriptional regulator AlpA